MYLFSSLLAIVWIPIIHQPLTKCQPLYDANTGCWDMEKRVFEMEKKIYRLENQKKTGVSFMATLGNDVKNPRPGIVIKFDQVIFNKGGGYSGTSGVFTTPVTGTYYFIVTLSIPAHSNARDYLRVHIMKNGVEASYLYVGAHNVWMKPSENTLLELQRGDRVYVSVGKTSSSEFSRIPGGGFHCHFTGFLID
ncbi:complement C1q tumor necrosis factor-related protein 2-like [Saccostrea cucullata]|uniref:complement C1q tumor necrosis factor-related protein 2-like n=1 Tax=Saccostrea cuccullata TaxID=36930 RepID=UPI002ED16599